MTYTKKTRRRMPLRVRRLVDAINDLDRGVKALKRMLPELAEWETSQRAIDAGIPSHDNGTKKKVRA